MKADIHRILTVRAVGAQAVSVAWDDGRTSTVDLAALIAGTPVLAPLRDETLFRRVQVGEDGWEIVWPVGPAGSVGEDAAVDAHHLERLAMEQSGAAMPCETFRAWRAANGLSLTAAARVLGISRRTVAYYESGARIIPRLVRLACKGADLELRA
ncbi:helix-turn-helix domain-containing protein [Desulfolutivibrio sp.]|jgi:DNA-binding XRE family transcriptional regulator|uniref:helix-turn-helix domain-containing protein n=1 Tax=Desulfolutivibrio sp. TaxID=2773296 RepID=UPI002F9653E1